MVNIATMLTKSLLLVMLIQVTYGVNWKIIDTSNKTEIQRNKLFYWNEFDGELISLTRQPWFQQRIITVGFIDYPPFTIYNETTRELEGFLPAVWDVVRNSLDLRTKFTTNLSIADIILHPETVERDLNDVYTKPVVYMWAHLYARDKGTSIDRHSYIEAFSPILWITFLSILASIMFCLWFILRFTRAENVPDRSLSVCFLSAIDGFCGQGSELELESYSGRALLVFSLVLGYFLMAAFSAVLMSRLAIELVTFPVNNLNEIAQQRSYSLCVEPRLYFNEYMNQMMTEDKRWKRLINGSHCFNTDEISNIPKNICRDKTLNLASVFTVSTLQYNKTLPCKILYLPHRYFMVPVVIKVKKNWPYLRRANLMISNMHFTGVMQYLEKKWLRPVHQEIQINYQNYVVIGLEHTADVWMFFGSCSAIAFGLLFLENLIFKIKNQKAENKKIIELID